MKTVAIIQARLNSTRLPGKVLYELAGRPALALLIERVRCTAGVDEVVVATGDTPANRALEGICTSLDIPVVAGPENDVLARFANAAQVFAADVIVRLTGDCPLADPAVIAAVLALRAKHNLDYCTNVHPPSWPDGLDVSVFTRDTLQRAAREASLRSEREHVVTWMWKHSNLEGGTALRAENLPCPIDLSTSRWTLDDVEDYRMLRATVAQLGAERAATATWQDIHSLLQLHPEITALNQYAERDAGLALSLQLDGQA